MSTDNPSPGRPQSAHKRTNSTLNPIEEHPTTMADLTKSKSEPALDAASASEGVSGKKPFQIFNSVKVRLMTHSYVIHTRPVAKQFLFQLLSR